jgi:hypothetical protein
MGIINRIKDIQRSRSLPPEHLAGAAAWKQLRREVAREESRLKALASRRQSVLDTAARWNRTGNRARSSGNTHLASYAEEQEKLTREKLKVIAGDPEVELTELERLKEIFRRLEKEGEGAPAALRGGSNKPGSEAYRLRLKERIKHAEGLIARRRS